MRRLLMALASGLALLPAGCPLQTTPSGDNRDAEDEAKATETASGLKYLDVKEGEGQAAKAGDVVVVHYAGRLRSNGKQFDSSRSHGRPFEFPLGAGRVIPGWDEGVAGMKPGGKRKLFVPAKLGYGAQGAGDDIPPNSDLVFDVELLEIRGER
jgi:FKBP-type peptidyl-prolyl cis-trans isomerase